MVRAAVPSAFEQRPYPPRTLAVLLAAACAYFSLPPSDEADSHQLQVHRQLRPLHCPKTGGHRQSAGPAQTLPKMAGRPGAQEPARSTAALVKLRGLTVLCVALPCARHREAHHDAAHCARPSRLHSCSAFCMPEGVLLSPPTRQSALNTWHGAAELDFPVLAKPAEGADLAVRADGPAHRGPHHRAPPTAPLTAVRRDRLASLAQPALPGAAVEPGCAAGL